jgi:hypothetical protein
MGLFEKRNPHASSRTVVRAAFLGAGGFALFTIVMLIWKGFPNGGWLCMLPFMTVFGAITGAAMNWQLSEDD